MSPRLLVSLSPSHSLTPSRAPLAALLLALLLLAGCARSATAPDQAPFSGELSLSVPPSVLASEPIPLEFAAAAPDGQAVTVVAQGSYGAGVYQTTINAGKAALLLPGEATKRSGALTLLATAGTARAEMVVEVLPGPPVDPVMPLVGPRSIIADGKHWTMAIAVPFDRYGNPVAENTPVEFQILHPGDNLETITVSTTNLLAWQRVWSTTAAGRTTVAVSAQGAHGPDATFLEVPDWPTSFGLSATPSSAPADGRQFLSLRSTVIRDRFGNAMVDGTLVTFVAEMAGSEPRFIPAYTIDGSAEALIQAPGQPGVMTVRATLYGVESRPLAITFTPGPAARDFPATAQVNARDGMITIAAGPMLGELGQFIPDGTLVLFHVTGPGGLKQTVEGMSEDGRASIELRLADMPPGAYTAEVVVGSGIGRATFEIQQVP